MRGRRFVACATLVTGLAVVSFVGRLGAADAPPAQQHHARLSAYAVQADKAEHVFYRNHENKHVIELYTKQGDATGWHWNDLTAEAKAPEAASGPDAYYWADNKTSHVFYRGTDDGIHELFRTDGGKWAHNDVTGAIKAPKADGEPAGYAEEGNKTQHLVYRTGDGDLVELYSKQGEAAGWRMRDLTMETKAPKAAGDPDAFKWQKTKTQHVLYRGSDDSVQELYTDPEGHWQHNDLTAVSKAPKAAGNPTAYVEEGNQTEHVVYRTEAGDIVELYAKYRETNQWNADNLSKDTNAPKAAGDPTGYRLREGRLRGSTTQHVLYRGADADIHEFFLGGSEKKWGLNDPTKEAGGPKALGDPVGYVLEANHTQHIVYRAEDHKIYELYNVPEGANRGWHANDLTAAAHVPGQR